MMKKKSSCCLDHRENQSRAKLVSPSSSSITPSFSIITAATAAHNLLLLLPHPPTQTPCQSTYPHPDNFGPLSNNHRHCHCHRPPTQTVSSLSPKPNRTRQAAIPSPQPNSNHPPQHPRHHPSTPSASNSSLPRPPPYTLSHNSTTRTSCCFPSQPPLPPVMSCHVCSSASSPAPFWLSPFHAFDCCQIKKTDRKEKPHHIALPNRKCLDKYQDGR